MASWVGSENEDDSGDSVDLLVLVADVRLQLTLRRQRAVAYANIEQLRPEGEDASEGTSGEDDKQGATASAQRVTSGMRESRSSKREEMHRLPANELVEFESLGMTVEIGALDGISRIRKFKFGGPAEQSELLLIGDQVVMIDRQKVPANISAAATRLRRMAEMLAGSKRLVEVTVKRKGAWGGSETVANVNLMSLVLSYLVYSMFLYPPTLIESESTRVRSRAPIPTVTVSVTGWPYPEIAFMAAAGSHSRATSGAVRTSLADMLSSGTCWQEDDLAMVGIILEGARVLRVVPGSPAHLACQDEVKIEAGDEVVAIDGKEVRDSYSNVLHAEGSSLQQVDHISAPRILREKKLPGTIVSVDKLKSRLI
eukprot:763395-Hanusia_phi.AAC.5